MVVKSQQCGPLGEFTRVANDEAVYSVAGVLVRRVEPLVNHEWLVQPIGLDHREAKCPVLLQSVRALHPVENELPFGLGALLVDPNPAERELVADVLRAEDVRLGTQDVPAEYMGLTK